MKKHLIIFTVLFATIAYGQEGRVGINTTEPKATLDVTASATDLTRTDGIIAPKLTGNQLKAKDSNYTNDQTGAIVYVTEALASVDTTAKTVNVTSVGYYYFDGTVWVRVANGGNLGDYDPTTDGWIDNPTTNSVDLVYPSLKDNISYTPDGYKAIDKLNTDILAGMNSVIDYKLSDNYNSYNNSFINSKNISNPNTSYGNLYGSNEFVKITDEETRANQTVVGRAVKMQTINSTININNLRGFSSSVGNYGSGNIANFVVGIDGSVANFSSGTANNVLGISGQASGQGTGTITSLFGIRGQSNLTSSQTSTITNMGGIQSSFNLSSGNAPITNLFQFHTSGIISSAYTGTITNSYDFYTNDYTGGATILNKYGLYITGISKRSYLQGSLGIGTNAPAAKLHIVKAAADLTPAIIQGCNEYADNAAAVTAGLPIGALYRTGDVLKVVH